MSGDYSASQRRMIELHKQAELKDREGKRRKKEREKLRDVRKKKIERKRKKEICVREIKLLI